MCACVCAREREKERERQTDRLTDICQDGWKVRNLKLRKVKSSFGTVSSQIWHAFTKKKLFIHELGVKKGIFYVL